MHLEAGTISIPIQPENTQFHVAVSFKTAYQQPPIVLCSLNDTGPYRETAYLTCMAWDVTPKGFGAYIKSTAPVPVTCNVTFSWIANGS